MELRDSSGIKDWAGRYTKNLERLEKIFDAAGARESVAAQLETLQVYANTLEKITYAKNGSANISDASMAILKNDTAIKNTDDEVMKAAFACIGEKERIDALNAYTAIIGFADMVAETLRTVERGAPPRRPG